MLRLLTSALLAVTLVLAGACDTNDPGPSRGAAAASLVASAGGTLGQYQPYQPNTAGVQNPPNGYFCAYFQSIGRHGSRAATSSTDVDSAIAFWDKAGKAGAVTAAGKSFGPDVRKVRAAMSKLGYGKLSTVGVQEWSGIGQRITEQLPDCMARLERSGARADFITSSSSRAQASATALFRGLDSYFVDWNHTKRQTNDKMLKLAASLDAGEAAALSKVYARADVSRAARETLEHLYVVDYVEKLSPSARLTAARRIWDAYSIAPSMAGNGAPSLTQYINPTDARVLAEVNDAEAFYRYGPGLAGTHGYRNAVVVRDNFFRVIDARLFEGGKSMATFRLSHGETLIPFQALLDLPGSEVQAPSSTPYSWATNPWRGDVHGKMAVNIDWTVYRSDPGKPILLTMRRNEQPIRFSASCAAAEVEPFFYDLAKLKRCVPRA